MVVDLQTVSRKKQLRPNPQLGQTHLLLLLILVAMSDMGNAINLGLLAVLLDMYRDSLRDQEDHVQ